MKCNEFRKIPEIRRLDFRKAALKIASVHSFAFIHSFSIWRKNSEKRPTLFRKFQNGRNKIHKVVKPATKYRNEGETLRKVIIYVGY